MEGLLSTGPTTLPSYSGYCCFDNCPGDDAKVMTMIISPIKYNCDCDDSYIDSDYKVRQCSPPNVSSLSVEAKDASEALPKAPETGNKLCLQLSAPRTVP